MRKNVAGQFIGAEIIAKADGTPLTTGTVTVYVAGDNGTQAAGSVGSGACAHKGNGYWSYAPAQAETNFDHIAWTFEHSSGVNVTVQVYPTFPQTGDSFARIGAAGAGLTALATPTNITAGVITTVTNLTNAPTNGDLTATMKTSVTTAATAATPTAAAVTGAVGSVAGLTASDVGAIKTKTDALPTDPADQSLIIAATNAITAAISALNNLDASGVRTAVGLASANLDTQLDALPTNAEMEARTLLAASYATAAGVSAVETDTQDIQGRLPAALTANGNIKADALRINGNTVTGGGATKWHRVP